MRFSCKFTLLYIQAVKLEISIESRIMFSIENLNKLSTGYSFCAKQGRNVKDLS
jgi:hypothetical protein